jgi:hypothetical protein
VHLSHLTDEAGHAQILATQQVRGRRGIFAVPHHVVHESPFWKSLRTGLSASTTTHHVLIPAAAVGLFARPLCLGPYSLWKFLGEIYVARWVSVRSIDVMTGNHPPHDLRVPWIILYGPDVLFWIGTAGWVAVLLDSFVALVVVAVVVVLVVGCNRVLALRRP